MRRLIFSFLLILLLTGCVRPESGVHIQNDTTADIKLAEEVFINDDRLTSVVAIFHEKELISGITVKTFSRFNKKKIEKEISKKLEELYQEFDVVVSADGKIINETAKLMNAEDKNELTKKIKKVKSLSEEET